MNRSSIGELHLCTHNSYFYDLNAKMTFRPTKKEVIALSFYNGQDDLDNSRNIDNSSFGGGGPFGGGGASGGW